MTLALQVQVLEQTLRNESCLHLAVIGMDFPTHRVTIPIGFLVEVLVAGDTAQGDHGRHPEMVGIGSDGVKGLLEGHLDFEAYAVELAALDGRKGKVRGYEDCFASMGMQDGNEANEDSNRSPNEIDHPIVE